MKTLGIDQLSVDERLSLVEEIWGSIASDLAPVSLPVPQQEDLRRRLKAHAACPDAGSPWEDVKARLEVQL